LSEQAAVASEPVARWGAGPALVESGRISPQALRHIEIRQAVLKAHPEAAALAGTEPWGLAGALVVLAIHWTALWLVSQTNVLVVFAAAFLFGQVALHSAGALIHETAHRLVFRDRRAKLAFDLLLEVITTSFGRQLTYQHEHLSSHHPHLGNYERDYEHEDVCRFLARRQYRAMHPARQHALTLAELFVHLLPLGFLFADRIFLPFYRHATGRAVKDRRRDIGATRPPRGEMRLFIAVSLAVNLFLFAGFGFLGWLYQIWSVSLFLGKCGVTNLGQSLAEHPGDDLEVPTRSTYWWGNAILFNTGYHHEHHTFPNVPWSRLPKLKATAPEAFDAVAGKSYFRCWWEHVRDDFSPSRRSPIQTGDLSERCAPPPR